MLDIYNKYDNILVGWSGGLDSTYFIWKALNNGFNITAVKFNIINNVDKEKREKESINKILPEFSKFSNFKFIDSGVNIEIFSKFDYVLKQVPIWILGLMSVIDENITKTALCYVMGDDAISFLDDIENIYNAHLKIMAWKPILTFPLKKINKIEILNELPLHIVNNITFCEGDKDNCGKCHPCIKWRMLELDEKFPKDVIRFNKIKEKKSRKK